MLIDGWSAGWANRGRLARWVGVPCALVVALTGATPAMALPEVAPPASGESPAGDGHGMRPVAHAVVSRILRQHPSSLPARCYDGFGAVSDLRYVVVQTAGGPCGGVYADGWSLFRRRGSQWSEPLVTGFPGQPSAECRRVRPAIPSTALRDLRVGGFCS